MGRDRYMSRIRVGFVGVGFMGQLAHLANYVLLDDCEVVAIAEPRPDLAEAVARRYGVREVYTDHRELLERAEIDAVVASQPFQRHASVVGDILEAGFPVFTEKPLCVSLDTGQRLVRTAEDRGLLHMVGYHKRSDPAIEHIRGMIDQWKISGEHGAMRYVRITMPTGDWIGGGAEGLIKTDEAVPQGEMEPPPDYLDESTGEKYISFINYYIHQVNLMRHILGESYEVTFADPSGRLMAVRSCSGVPGTIEMDPYSTSRDWQESLLVGFDSAYIEVNLPPPLASQRSGRVKVMTDNRSSLPTELFPTMPSISAMRNQASNFISALRGNGAVPCDSREALEDLRVASDYVRLLQKTEG